jgi:hypothetical protein
MSINTVMTSPGIEHPDLPICSAVPQPSAPPVCPKGIVTRSTPVLAALSSYLAFDITALNYM